MKIKIEDIAVTASETTLGRDIPANLLYLLGPIKVAAYRQGFQDSDDETCADAYERLKDKARKEGMEYTKKNLERNAERLRADTLEEGRKESEAIYAKNVKRAFKDGYDNGYDNGKQERGIYGTPPFGLPESCLRARPGVQPNFGQSEYQSRWNKIAADHRCAREIKRARAEGKAEGLLEGKTLGMKQGKDEARLARFNTDLRRYDEFQVESAMRFAKGLKQGRAEGYSEGLQDEGRSQYPERTKAFDRGLTEGLRRGLKRGRAERKAEGLVDIAGEARKEQATLRKLALAKAYVEKSLAVLKAAE